MPVSTSDVRRATSHASRKPGVATSARSFLSSLETFCILLDADPSSTETVEPAGLAALLNTSHYRLAIPVQSANATALCGPTWARALAAVLELASQAGRWARGRGFDVNHPFLSELWQDCLALSWFAESIARMHLVPQPLVAWQAGMLLAAAGLGEQLRLLEESGESGRRASLGPAVMQQLEQLIIGSGLPEELSAAAAHRTATQHGAWPCVSLGFSVGFACLSSSAGSLAWGTRFFERLQPQSTHPTLERAMEGEFARLWPEYREIAAGAWRLGQEVTGTAVGLGGGPRMRLHFGSGSTTDATRQPAVGRHPGSSPRL